MGLKWGRICRSCKIEQGHLPPCCRDKMDVVRTLRANGVGEAARLIGSAPQYVTDTNFINLLNQYDFNDKKKDAGLNSQLSLFTGVPGLREQVKKWLSS